MDRVLFIPLDDRPCCLDMMERIASLADSKLVMPPRETLGQFQDPGRPKEILDWLETQDADLALVMSIDMVTWGGLIASRHPDSDAEIAMEHFQRLLALIKERTGPTLAFKTLLRTAPTQTTSDEVDQAEQIIALSRLSFLYEKSRLGPQTRSLKNAIERLKTGINPSALERYLAVRQRNHRFDSLIVSKAEHFDALLIAMDDCQTEGWNLSEKERLEKQAQESGKLVDFYPGTDESAALLLCRLLVPESGFEPVWAHTHFPLTQTIYEDRPLGALLHAQTQAAHLRQGRCSRKLFLWGRTGSQREAAHQTTARANEISIRDSFLDQLEVALDRGDSCVVADLAFANGGDLGFVEALIERGLAARLTGYAAWNTAGNTLGTALATLALYPDEPSPSQERARQVLLWERLVDDAFYQSRFRFRLKREFGSGLILSGDELSQAQRMLSAEFHQFASDLWERLFPENPPLPFTIKLPWGRLFEVAIDADDNKGTTTQVA